MTANDGLTNQPALISTAGYAASMAKGKMHMKLQNNISVLSLLDFK